MIPGLPKLKEQNDRRYVKGDAGFDLETRMLEKQIFSVGSLDSWKSRVNERGEERLGSLDMSRDARAYRTLDIRKLNLEELKKIHAHELKRMVRFIIGPTEIRIILKNKSIEDQVFLQPNQMESVQTFNDNYRPLMDRQFLGLTIPPYFYYDYDFDGMAYHHAWDLSVWNQAYTLPLATGKKGRTSDVVTMAGES